MGAPVFLGIGLSKWIGFGLQALGIGVSAATAPRQKDTAQDRLVDSVSSKYKAYARNRYFRQQEAIERRNSLGSAAATYSKPKSELTLLREKVAQSRVGGK